MKKKKKTSSVSFTMTSPTNISLSPSLLSFLSSSLITHSLHLFIQGCSFGLNIGRDKTTDSEDCANKFTQILVATLAFISLYLSSLLFPPLNESPLIFSSSSLLWAISSVSPLITPQLNSFILHFTFPASLFHLFFFSLCCSVILSHCSPLMSSLIHCPPLSFSTSCFFST